MMMVIVEWSPSLAMGPMCNCYALVYNYIIYTLYFSLVIILNFSEILSKISLNNSDITDSKTALYNWMYINTSDKSFLHNFKWYIWSLHYNKKNAQLKTQLKNNPSLLFMWHKIYIFLIISVRLELLWRCELWETSEAVILFTANKYSLWRLTCWHEYSKVRIEMSCDATAQTSPNISLALRHTLCTHSALARHKAD